MPNVPINKSFLYDVLETAMLVDGRFAQYLLPTIPGIYIRGQLEPAMIPNEYYFQRVKVNGRFEDRAVSGIDDIKCDVFNVDAEMVIPKQFKRMLTIGPAMPVTAIRMVKAVTENLVDNHSAWSRKSKRGLGETVGEFLTPTYKNNIDLQEGILDLLLDLRSQVIGFIGDDKWIMHFVSMKGAGTLMVNKTIDYRIYDWQQRMDTGEWM